MPEQTGLLVVRKKREEKRGQRFKTRPPENVKRWTTGQPTPLLGLLLHHDVVEEMEAVDSFEFYFQVSY